MGTLATATLGFALAFAAAAVHAQEIATGFKAQPSGVIEIDGGITADIMHFGDGYASTNQAAGLEQTGLVDKGALDLSSKFNVKGGSFALTEKITKAGDSAIDVAAAVKDEKGVNTEELSLCVNIPVDAFKGKKITAGDKTLDLPVELPENNFLGWFPKRASVSIPLPSGKTLTISGTDISFLVQDNRKWKSNVFALRINFEPAKGKPLTEAKLALKFEIK